MLFESGLLHQTRPLLYRYCRRLLITVPLFFTGLSCVSDYNPFTDQSNARVAIVTTLKDGDTTEIFSSETLVVYPLVRELIESITLYTESNRFFSDTVVHQDKKRWPKDRGYRFAVSFYDTGWQQMRCITKRENGDEVTDERFLYVRSPLKQPAISGASGDEICLDAEPVRDQDVIYHWLFGGSMLIEAVSDSVCEAISTNGVSTGGLLWVSDFDGKHVSPQTPFFYTLVDKQGPRIICINDKAVGKDSVIASSFNFGFRVHIFDQGDGRISNATINGAPFDAVYNQNYLKNVSLIDSGFNPLELTVRAVDVFNNETKKRFWVVYDSTAPRNNNPYITIFVPSENNAVVSVPQWIFYGMVVSPTSDSFSLVMDYRLNGAAVSEQENVNGNYRAPWSYTASLKEGLNNLRITASDTNGTIIADTSLSIFLDDEMKDSTPPVIVEMQVGNQIVTGKSVTVQEKTTTLRVVAFDEGTGIDRVLVNGNPISKISDVVGYIWKVQVSATHRAEGSNYTILVRDHADFATLDTVIIRQNQLPRIIRFPNPPVPVVVGTDYIDTIAAIDDDDDIVRYTKSGGSPTLVVDSLSGAIFWKPELADRGIDTVSITLQDPFGALLYSYAIRVVDPSDITNRIRFLTTEHDFPIQLAAGVDTLYQQLELVAGTGIPPFRFTVTAEGIEDQDLYIDSGTIVKWIPRSSNAGLYGLVITVIDSFGNQAALYPKIRIVSPGSPVLLSSSWSGTVTNQSELDLSNTFSPETLNVTLHDSVSNELIDTFTVQYTLGDIESEVYVVNGLFQLTFDPSIKKTDNDTLSLTVTDNTGHVKTRAFQIRYGLPPEPVQLISPLDDTVLTDTMVTLRWNGTDTSNTYTLLLTFEDTMVVQVGSIESGRTSVVVTVQRAGRYYWQLRGSDNTESSIGSFIIDPPGRVRFSTTEADFPAWLEAERDSLALTLAVIPGTGTAPFAVTVSGIPGSAMTVQGMDLRWHPVRSDTGTAKLTVTVSDVLGNRDTLHPVVRIRPPNRPPVLSLSHSLPTTGDGAIDLRAITQPVELVFTISDPDPQEAEFYTLHSLLRHTEKIEAQGNERRYTVTLDPTKAVQGLDTLIIWVEDPHGLRDTSIVRIYYFRKSEVSFNTTADGVALTEDVYNVPILLRLNETNFDYSLIDSTNVAFRFTKKDGTILPYHVEAVDRIQRRSYVWVLMDTIYANRTTQNFYARLVYNVPHLSSGPAVFGAFEGAWHLDPGYAGSPGPNPNPNPPIIDVSGNNNTATYYNNGFTFSVDGIAGYAIPCRQNQYADIGNPSNLQITDTLTIEAWVYLNPDGVSSTDYFPIVTKGVNGYFLEYDQVNKHLLFGIGDGSGGWHIATSDSIIEEKQWVYVVGRFDGGQGTLFVNGIKQVESWTATEIPSSDSSVQIGRYADLTDRWYQGTIDEIRIAATAKSDSWIRISYEGVQDNSQLFTIVQNQ